MDKSKTITPPDETQVERVLNLFNRVTDPFQRGKIIGKLEGYVEQSESQPINTEKTA